MASGREQIGHNVAKVAGGRERIGHDVANILKMQCQLPVVIKKKVKDGIHLQVITLLTNMQRHVDFKS